MFVIFPLEDILANTPTYYSSRLALPAHIQSVSEPCTPQNSYPDSLLHPVALTAAAAAAPAAATTTFASGHVESGVLPVVQLGPKRSRSGLHLPGLRTSFSALALSSSATVSFTDSLAIFSKGKTNKKSPISSMTSECVLKELAHPSHAETLKAHSAVTTKLLKTVSEFTQQLSAAQEQHAEQLQQLVETFRKKNAELRKDRPAGVNSLFQLWETLLQEVEVDSVLVAETATCLGRQVSRPLLEGTFHRKLEARKIFQHRETLENTLAKAAEQLEQSYILYDDAYQKHVISPNTLTLATYLELHNVYVQDVHAANAMSDQYHNVILPQLIEELENVYMDLSSTIATAIQQGCEAIANRTENMSKRYSSLVQQCKSVNSGADLTSFVRAIGPIPYTSNHMRFTFMSPRILPNISPEFQDMSLALKDELVFDRLAGFSLRTKHESLKKEVGEVEAQIRQLNDCLDTLNRIQQRSLEANLYNKANELQEDICVKRLDLRMAQLHLAATRAQRDLYGARTETVADGSSNRDRDRKFSSNSSGSMKTKWMKAFRTLTNSSSSSTTTNVATNNTTTTTTTSNVTSTSTTSSTSTAGNELDKGSRLYQAVMAVMALRKTGTKDKGSDLSKFVLESRHIFQEYTYKKITPCDVCSQILRGHSRQGLKCRLCKINVHVDCKEAVGRCIPKSRLLRRQKSTSEIEARISEPRDEDENQEIDPTYVVLKQAGEMSGTSNTNRRFTTTDLDRTPVGVATATTPQLADPNNMGVVHRRLNNRSIPNVPVGNPNSLSVGHPSTFHSSSSAPHSPRRQKLNLRMKSLSLDESGEHFNKRHPRCNATHSASQGSSFSQSPSSPVHNRRLLSARNIRMNSVELPDENEKSQSSASASPCPSPKPHRLLPTNLYVVLFNFKSRESDELDLKAGYKVTVIDSSDPDWWKGKCLGKIGYFPSKYVAKLAPGEKPLQVTHNLQINESDGAMKLLRDQIVIQVSDEQDGMVTVRNGDQKQGLCPIQYLQEV